MLRHVACALILVVPACASAQATFRADAARSGVYPSSGPLTTPSVRWTFKTAGPIVTTPARAGRQHDVRRSETTTTRTES